MLSIAKSSMVWYPTSLLSSISAPLSAILLGITSSPGISVSITASSRAFSPVKTEYMVRVTSFFSTPNPVVALPCGSMSTTKTCLP